MVDHDLIYLNSLPCPLSVCLVLLSFFEFYSGKQILLSFLNFLSFYNFTQFKDFTQFFWFYYLDPGLLKSIRGKYVVDDI